MEKPIKLMEGLNFEELVIFGNGQIAEFSLTILK